MTDTDEFDALAGLIGSYLHQDMDLEYETVPEAIAGYSRVSEASRKEQLLRDMDAFLERYHNSLEAEFAKRYGFDFTPDIIGQSVPEFFDMVRTILADPESYARYEPIQ